MKKISFFIYTALIGIVTLFILPLQAQALVSFEFQKNVPGMTCGVGGSGNETAHCCDMSGYKVDTYRLPSAFETFPLGIGAQVTSYNNKAQRLEDLQKQGFSDACVVGTASASITDPSCKCVATASSSAVPGVKDLCDRYIHTASDVGPCVSCANSGGYYSGFGCIPLNLSEFISRYILGTGIGLAGGIAMLCIMYSAFRMQTSQGNPEAIKKAQENLTSCITGLILIIFSVLILRIIAGDILRIPGFS